MRQKLVNKHTTWLRLLNKVFVMFQNITAQNARFMSLYAGQTDLVGVHKGQDAIMDFKQTNKPKKREWIEDYCLQLAAYAMALILFTKHLFQKV